MVLVVQVLFAIGLALSEAHDRKAGRPWPTGRDLIRTILAMF
jgi:hypothetical protein